MKFVEAFNIYLKIEPSHVARNRVRYLMQILDI